LAEDFSVRRYLRDVSLPFCPGCGNVIVMSRFLKAIHELGHKDLNKFVFCSGIGCAAWIPSPHFKADSIHTPHGRSIPVATGVKLVRPESNVVVFGGDGDLLGIGLSHLIHAARRNQDIVVVLVNNMIYGMTGGQVAPTTPLGFRTTTTPYGSFERPLDAARLLAVAGACYVARWTTVHVEQLVEAMKRAITTDGFAFVEVVSQCPTAFGRRVGLKTSLDILRWFKQNSVLLQQAKEMNDEDLEGKIVIGEFVRRKLPSFSKTIYKVREVAKGAKKK
jgi:Pyruvate:ferredoxin oxidoreductase and related 2-oxoacid:ferredoxin oxidoreductases, beta subunit